MRNEEEFAFYFLFLYLDLLSIVIIYLTLKYFVSLLIYVKENNLLYLIY